MTRKSVIERNEKRKVIVEKYRTKRELVKQQRKDAFKNGDFNEVIRLNHELASFPRDSVPIRVRNRCAITGRSRGYRRLFGLCRNKVREFAYKAPGVIKS